jgi:endonuclease/exonuclease/phosphatase family metal-dependent hydrolase
MVMILNIIHLNTERDKHTDKVIKLLKNKKPDVVCLAEAMIKDVKLIATKLGYEFAFAPLFIVNDEKYTNEEQGSAILSKYPIKEVNKYRYDDGNLKEIPVRSVSELISKDGGRPKDRFDYFYTLLTALIEMEKGKNVTISTTHFPVVDRAISGLEGHNLNELGSVDEIEHSELYLERLIKIIRNLKYPLVFTSDLNNPRGDYFYDSIAHELVDIVPQTVDSTIDPAFHRISNLKLPVDTIMVSPEISANNFEVIEGVSDHKALFASININ